MRDRCELYTPVLYHAITVKIHGAKFKCTGCGLWKNASDFGLLYDEKAKTVRNQPQCKRCR